MSATVRSGFERNWNRGLLFPALTLPGGLGMVPRPAGCAGTGMVEVKMADRRLLLIVGIVLGACLPGCLRPFGHKQETADSWEYNAPPNPPPQSGYSPSYPQPQRVIKGERDDKDESIGSPKSTSGVLLVPGFEEDNTPGPDNKPEMLESLILQSPDLTGLGTPANSGRAPGIGKKQDLLGQLGPVTSAPPNSEEATEPPSPKTAAVQTIHSDYPTREPLLDAITYMLAKQYPKAIDSLKSYDRSTQEFFIGILPVMVQLTQKPLEQWSPEQVETIQKQIESLSNALRPRSQLLITKMCFCKSIKAYAMYDPLPEDYVFRASSNSRSLDGDVAQVYVELSNFCCKPQHDYHEIHLSSSVEIQPAKDAKAIWFKRFDDSKQPPVRSRAQLHDYFCRYYFAVPHLPAGDYIMTIKVVDETNPDKPPAEKSLPIHVSAAHPTTP